MYPAPGPPSLQRPPGPLAVSEPDADGRFLLPDDGAVLTFELDEDGRARTMRFQTERAEQELPRIQEWWSSSERGRFRFRGQNPGCCVWS